MGAGNIAGAAANVVGGEMQGWASILAQREMDRAFSKELKRQAGYRDQVTNQVLYPHLNTLSAENANATMQNAAGDRIADYSKAMPSDAAPLDAAYLKMMGDRRAKLGAYGDWSQNMNVAGGRTQDDINRVISRAGGQANIFPLRMQDAQHSWDQLAAAGAMIAAIGGSAANMANYATAPNYNPGHTISQQPSMTYQQPNSASTFVWMPNGFNPL